MNTEDAISHIINENFIYLKIYLLIYWPSVESNVSGTRDVSMSGCDLNVQLAFSRSGSLVSIWLSCNLLSN